MPLRLGIVDQDRPPRAAGRDRAYRRLLALADVLAVAASLWLTVGLLGTSLLEPLAFLALPLVVAVSKVVGLYDRDEVLISKSTLDEAPKLFHAATLFALVFVLFETSLVKGEVSSAQWAILWLSMTVLLVGLRVAARVVAGRATEPERCLLIGDGLRYARLDDKLQRNHAELVGWVPSSASGHPREVLDGIAPVPLGTLVELRRTVERNEIHRVVIASDGASDSMLDVIRQMKAAGVRVSVLPRLLEVVGSSMEFDQVHGATLMGVRRFGLTRSSMFLKRALDVLVAGFALAVTAPWLALAALAIRIDSPGGVLFRQTRIGRDGTPFEILKLRTMVEHADGLKPSLMHRNEAEGLFKITDDPRVTRVGRLMRRTSLDELPQLMNVLRGDMSLVGPRPLVEDDDRRVVGWHRQRLKLMPGMTGPWQVLGSSRIPLDEMVTIDYLYVANWSLWTDVRILLRTLRYVFSAGSR